MLEFVARFSLSVYTYIRLVPKSKSEPPFPGMLSLATKKKSKTAKLILVGNVLSINVIKEESQNQGSTEGCSKCIVRKNNDKFGKRIKYCHLEENRQEHYIHFVHSFTWVNKTLTFQNYVSKVIKHPFFYRDQVSKLISKEENRKKSDSVTWHKPLY